MKKKLNRLSNANIENIKRQELDVSDVIAQLDSLIKGYPALMDDSTTENIMALLRMNVTIPVLISEITVSIIWVSGTVSFIVFLFFFCFPSLMDDSTTENIMALLRMNLDKQENEIIKDSLFYCFLIFLLLPIMDSKH